MKPGIKAFLVLAVIFAVTMFSVIWTTTRDPYEAAITAPFAGVLFAVFILIFGKRTKRRFEINPPSLDPDETIFYSGPANHFRKLEGVGGFLYLTSHELLFRPHSFNIQKGDFSLPCPEIKSIDSDKKTWGFMENRLIVTNTAGTSNTFIVYQPKLWAEKIASQLKAG